MNYRHIYHAGNFSDVVKHYTLTLLLQKLHEKEKAFSIIDTHAGIGGYNLQSLQALKTNEAQEGIFKLLDSSQDKSLFEQYLKVVQSQEAGFYPGSPLISHALLRPQDRLWLSELHPDDFQSLAQLFYKDPQVKVLHQDGYTSLKSLLPPKEKRGLILIDPPFEDRNEFKALVNGVQESYKRFATGIYMLWFPIKNLKPIKEFYSALKGLDIPKILAVEFLRRPPVTPDILNGTGLVIINPPWKIEEKIVPALESLLKIFEFKEGSVRLEWLSEEVQN
jgi:23S rRNA (adenine2030-N6)-methyltransferase